MTPHEETVILEAREILGRYLNQNPVLGSWQAVWTCPGFVPVF